MITAQRLLACLALLTGVGPVLAAEGWYVGGQLGTVNAEDGEGSVLTPGNDTQQQMFSQFSVGHDSGTAMGLFGGYQFEFGRVELVLQQLSSGITEPAATELSSSEITAEGVLMNAWADFRTERRFRPYAGGGLGVANLKLDPGSERVPTFQLGAGVGWSFSASWILDAGLRYLDFGAAEVERNGDQVRTDYGGLAALLSVRYQLFQTRDGDGDGVYDQNDDCPNTPSGYPVDSSGCALDSDKDGVSNPDDRCPNTPAGVRVDSSGCARDSDGDGVPDDEDACPGTPSGSAVDSRGCIPDLDRDGVADVDDQCPDTAPNEQVLANGCAPAQSVVLQGVQFETGSARLLIAAEAILDEVARTLMASPGFDIAVDGHTDHVGSEASNRRLAQRRADAVMSYLVSRGVSAARLLARGFGEDRPVASNATSSGRAMNRRVEMTVLGRTGETTAQEASASMRTNKPATEPKREMERKPAQPGTELDDLLGDL